MPNPENVPVTEKQSGVLDVPNYLKEYRDFMSSYKRTELSAEEAGEMILKAVAYFAEYNFKMVSAEDKLARIAMNIESRTDESTGKQISSTKAKIYVEATDEASAFNLSRAHVQNIEQIINGLKAMQKALLNEYAHSGI